MRDDKKRIIIRRRPLYPLIVGVLIGVLLYQVFNLHFLPLEFFIAIAFVLVMLFIALFATQFKKKPKIVVNLGKWVSLLLVIVLAIANFYLYRTDYLINYLLTNRLHKEEMSLVVLKDGSDNIEDYLKKDIAVTSVNKNYNQKVLQEIQKEFSSKIDTEDYNSNITMAFDLIDGNIDMMILNEGYRGLIEENYSTFSEETKVIKVYDFQYEIVNNKKVDVRNESFNIYISGIDIYGDIVLNSRSDVNLVVSVNPKTERILITTIPRDYYVKMSCVDNAYDKLTHAGIYSVDCSMKTIEGLLDIDINYHVRVNFSSVEEIVDALGGIEINSENSFTSNDGYTYQEGLNKLNGKEALSFVRDRDHQPNGDIDRGLNQTKALKAIIQKLASFKLVTNYLSIVDAIGGNVQTSFDSKEISQLISMQMRRRINWNIENHTMLGENAYNYSYAIGGRAFVIQPDRKSIEETKSLIDGVLNGN